MRRNLLWLCAIPPLLLAQEYKIKNGTFAGGGTMAFSSQNRICSAAGQPMVASAFSVSYGVKSGFWHGPASRITAVAPAVPSLPAVFELYPAYPNPFNPSGTIVLEIPGPCRVTLTVYDLLGRKVRELLDENRPAGRFTLHWDGSDKDGIRLPSGLYIYRMEADGFAASRSMVLVR
jgi:hypothetical protein